jgi:hypothetical protein
VADTATRSVPSAEDTTAPSPPSFEILPLDLEERALLPVQRTRATLLLASEDSLVGWSLAASRGALERLRSGLWSGNLPPGSLRIEATNGRGDTARLDTFLTTGSVLKLEARRDTTVARASLPEPLALWLADSLSAAWRHAAALNVLSQTRSPSPRIRWRRGRSLVDLGESIEAAAAESFFERARREAMEAAEEEPASFAARLVWAIASGRLAEHRGPLHAKGLVRECYRNAHLVLEGTRDSLHVTTYVLGRVHHRLLKVPPLMRKLGGLDFASADSAAHYLEWALEASGRNSIQALVEYAELLWEEEQGRGRALELLEEALALRPRDHQDGPTLERARGLMARWLE